MEYIAEYVAHSNELSRKCGMGEQLKVYQGDAISGKTDPKIEHKCDGMLTILCILHLPGSERSNVWSNIARMLNSGARVFVHDFYAVGSLSQETKKTLADQGIAPDLPSKDE